MNPKPLEDALFGVFSSYPGAEESALKMAQAYYDYASTATFGTVNKAMPPYGLVLPVAALLRSVVMIPAIASSVMFATAWSIALTTFWPGVPVVGPKSGAVVLCPGASALTPVLSALLDSRPPTIRELAQRMADALNTATLTTTALLTLPPPTIEATID